MMNHTSLVKNKFYQAQAIAHEEIIGENEDILITNDLNNELIFSNIPTAQLNISDQLKPKLSQTMNSCADSVSSSSSSLSTSSLADQSSLNNVNFNSNFSENKDSFNKVEEYEILRSIQNLVGKHKWSTKLVRTESVNFLVECDSCDFSLNISNLIQKFKRKLDENNFAYYSSPSKCLNELINYYLIKLINVLFVRHECKNNTLNQLIIKNFFRHFDKIDLDIDEENVNQVNLNDSSLKQNMLYKLKRHLNDYFDSMDSYTNIDLNTSFDLMEKQYDPNQEVALDEDDTLLANLESLDDFDLSKSKENNADDEGLVLSSDNQIQFSKTNLNNQSSYDGSGSCDDTSSSILKAINKRKLHLSCPICNSSVVNMSDHLVKKHSIRDRNQRKYIMDIVRKNYIFESKTNPITKEINLNIKQQFSKVSSLVNNTTARQTFAPKNSLERETEATNPRKIVKCPICLDDNKYFVNISDHLIKIHHLITSETRKPILKQIKEKSLSYSLNRPQQLETSTFSTDTRSNLSTNKEQIYPDFNFTKEAFSNDKLENDSDQLNINDLLADKNQSDQILEQNSNSRTLSKRKPLKSKRFSLSNFQAFSNQNDMDDDELIQNDNRDKTGKEDEEEEENLKNCCTGGADDDSDYSGLIGLNYEPFSKSNTTTNMNGDKNETEEFIQTVDFMTDSKDFQLNEIENFKKRKSSVQLYDTNLNGSVVFDDNMSSDEPLSISNKIKKIKHLNSSNNNNLLNISKTLQPCDSFNENVSNYDHNNLNEKYLDDRYENYAYNNNLTSVKSHAQQQINKSSTLSSEANSVIAFTNSSDKLISSNSDLDQIWSKINSFESSLRKTYKNFEVFTDSLLKQVNQFTNTFQATLDELDALKSLIPTTSASQHQVIEEVEENEEEMGEEEIFDKEQTLAVNSKKVLIKKALN